MFKKYTHIWVIICFVVFNLNTFSKILAEQNKEKSKALSYEINTHNSIQHPHRVGINLGQWNSLGSQQYMRNVLMNPGLEGRIDRIIIVASQADENSFSDETGMGYPDNSWSGAEYEIRSGRFIGERGKIVKSARSGSNGFPQYFSQEPLPPIEKGNVIVLTKKAHLDEVDLWRINDFSVVRVDYLRKRPGSYGKQSVSFKPTLNRRAEMTFDLDTIFERAGKMLPINGNWEVSLWAYTDQEGTPLTINFQRNNGSPPLFQKTIILNSEWKKYEFEFSGKDNGFAETLNFSIIATVPEREIWIDDLYLGPQQKGSSTFRQEIIHALRNLHPSYLREFPHLGDTLDNRLAGAYSRGSWIFHLAANQSEPIYSYSWIEFLDLCEEIGSNPWLIIPPTFSDYELHQLGVFLSQKASKRRFSEVIVEFGHENWNWLLRPQGIPYSQQYGELAKRAFEKISNQTKDRVNLRKLVNGAYTLPEISLENLASTSNADGVSIAPYFFHSINDAVPDEEALKLLFKSDTLLEKSSAEVMKQKKNLAVYEVNLHTTKGTAVPYERNRLVAGAAAGSALAKKIIESLLIGADPIMVYNLAQHDSSTWDVFGFVNLWGVVRDFGPPLRFRPTGLAMIMLNDVIAGEMYRVSSLSKKSLQAEKITMVAFQSKDHWTAAIVSENEIPVEIEIEFPKDDRAIPNLSFSLDSSSPFSTNENGEEVSIKKNRLQTDERRIKFFLPAWGFVTLNFDAL
jgi:hypothetical protein